VEFDTRRSACNAVQNCVFSGRSVTGHCWTAHDLAVSEALKYQEVRRAKRDKANEQMYEDSSQDENDGSTSEAQSRAKYFSKLPELPPLPKLSKDIITATQKGFNSSLQMSGKVSVQHLDDNFQDDADNDSDSQSPNLPRALNALGTSMKDDLKENIASNVAKNIEAQNEETKNLAVALVTTTLADPDLPKKVAAIISDFSAKPHVKEATASYLADYVVRTDWLYKLTLPLVQRQLEWWLITDDLPDPENYKFLRKEVSVT